MRPQNRGILIFWAKYGQLALEGTTMTVSTAWGPKHGGITTRCASNPWVSGYLGPQSSLQLQHLEALVTGFSTLADPSPPHLRSSGVQIRQRCGRPPPSSGDLLSLRLRRGWSEEQIPEIPSTTAKWVKYSRRYCPCRRLLSM